MYYPHSNETYCVHDGRTMIIDKPDNQSDMAKALLGFARELAQETTDRLVSFLLRVSLSSDEYAYQNQCVYQPLFESDIELTEITPVNTRSVTHHTYRYTFQKVSQPVLV